MNDPALLAATLFALDQAITALMRARVALEVVEFEARQNAPELHEEAQGRVTLSTFEAPHVAA